MREVNLHPLVRHPRTSNDLKIGSSRAECNNPYQISEIIMELEMEISSLRLHESIKCHRVSILDKPPLFETENATNYKWPPPKAYYQNFRPASLEPVTPSSPLSTLSQLPPLSPLSPLPPLSSRSQQKPEDVESDEEDQPTGKSTMFHISNAE